MKKLKAFTLMELTVAMTLTGLLMVLAGFAYVQVNKYFRSYYNQSYQHQELLMMHELMRNDIINAQVIKKSRFGFEVFNNGDKIYYEFYNGEISRKRGFDVRKFEFSFEDIEYKMIPQLNDVVYHIQFTTLVEKQPIDLVFSKTYEKRFLFDLEFQKSI